MIRPLYPAVAWLLVLAASAVLLVDVGNSLASVLLVGAYWAWSILLPGFVVYRLAFPESPLVAALGVGGVLGLGAELALRPVSIVLAQPLLLWLTPLLLLPLLAVPAARARLRRRPGKTDARTAVLTAVVSLLSVVMLWSTYLRRWAPPEQEGSWYADLMFHLAIIRNLQLETWPSDPQVAGTPLDYHWFADSHVASVSLATRVAAGDVALHLWLVPILLLTTLVVSALAAEISSRWWFAPAVAGLTMVGGSAVMMDPRIQVRVEAVVQPLSPSQMVATPVYVALLLIVLKLLRGPDRPALVWALFLGLTGLATGVKPTVLPMLAAGLVLVLVWRAWSSRRLDRPAAVMLAVVTSAFLLTGSLLAGSTGGSSLVPFALLRGWPLYESLTGDSSPPGAEDAWLDAFSSVSGTAVVVTLVVAFLAMQAFRWIGLLALFPSRHDPDPAGPLLVGTAAAGWAGLLLLDHPGQSQHYFLYTGLPVMVLLAAWSIDRVAADVTIRWTRAVAVGLLGALVAGVGLLWPLPETVVGLWVIGVLVAVCVIAVLVTRVGAGFPRMMVPALAALLAMSLPLWVVTSVKQHRVVEVALAEPNPRGFVSTAEIEAAQRLDAMAAPEDVVLTNVHCQLARRARCDARAFWVAAVAGQRVFLGAWAYTPENLANRDPDEHYAQGPSPWPRRLEISQAAVQHPRPGLLRSLADRGVRWIYADRNHSRVSPRLAAHADLRFENAEVQVFELRPRRS